MNDLVFVMSNLKLRNKQKSKSSVFEFDDIQSDDEWI
ncbi:Glucose-1-phosphate adenylyltransferase small subunit 1, chloroplastic isoform A [Senna tora]|uniref:Glucose-1-phosphate adenylyltransferase small subunit 1, chloroplastic isoform A n=1 Tax=Senna tora TaxID=362788 RepID=A0A834XBC9_9FABA|nr:Glucose-1-phosphate adenylyltransferase small subunit 1, chloroplastic isoform A [Senna tora]